MKPNTELTDTLLDNADQFQNDFFRRFTLRQASEPLALTDTIAKKYYFPTLYADVTCAIALFFCSYEKAQTLLPHPKMKPVNMLQGRSLVIFSCYEYKRVRNIVPYNEIAMSIPVLMNPSLDLPILPLLISGFKGFGYYVFSMPVTSLENEIRGHKLWGLPKVLQEIEMVAEGETFVTTARDASGDPYFELRVPTEGKAADFDVSSSLFSVRDGHLLRSETHFQGSFTVRQHPQVLFRKSLRPDTPYLHLGESRAAAPLKQLEIEPHPFQTRFARSMSSCFDLPLPLPPLA